MNRQYIRKSSLEPSEITPDRSLVMSPAAILSARKALNMSQTQLARALGLTRRQTVCDWELGKKTPKPYVALAIKHLLSLL